MTGNRERRSVKSLPYSGPSIRVTRVISGLPKVLILHDVPILIDAIKELLGGIANVIGESSSGHAAVSICELLTPDVVIIGEMLSDGVAEYFVPALLQTGTRVLYMTYTTQRSEMTELLDLGVTGIIDGDHSPEDVMTAVQVLAAGGAFLPPDLVATIAAEWRRGRRKATNEEFGTELTEREAEVLRAMSDGMSAKAIGHHLGIAVKTVENHKTRIFDKLGVRSQAQAVALVHGQAGSNGYAVAPGFGAT